MTGTVVFDGSTSESFEIKSGVKQGCVLAPTLFGIFFAVLLKHAFGTFTEGIYLRTRSDGKLFNLSRLKAKTEVHHKCLRDFLFADDAAITTHTEEGLQLLMDRFDQACVAFGLLSVKTKRKSLGRIQPHYPTSDSLTKHWKLSTTLCIWALQSPTLSLSLDAELDRRIGKAATTMSRLNKRVWTNARLTEHTKIQVYKACVVSTLLYGSESWTTRSKQEHTLNAFYMRYLRRILGITWQDKVTYISVLDRAKVPSMYSLLQQRCLRWLGHVVRMEDDRIPKDLLYGELNQETRSTGRPKLRYKDVCKRLQSL